MYFKSYFLLIHFEGILRMNRNSIIIILCVIIILLNSHFTILGLGNQELLEDINFIEDSSINWPSPENSYDWPEWRGINRDSTTKEADWNPARLKNGPVIVWYAEIGRGYSSVSIEGGYLYTMGNINNVDTVSCLSVTNGNLVWSHSYKCDTGIHAGSRATPLIHNKHVYTLSEKGHVFCFNAIDGNIIWQKHLVNDFKLKDPSDGRHRRQQGSAAPRA